MSLLLCLLILSASASSQVLIGSFDTQFDISHEALQGKMWVNSAEIPDDGIDNDQNGYVDDIHGWNFADNNSTLFEADLNIFNVQNILYGEYTMRRRAGVATTLELEWLEQHDSTLGPYHRPYITYLHGTSSASVNTRNTKNTKVIGLRISPREDFIFKPQTLEADSEEIPSRTPLATEKEIAEVLRAYIEEVFPLFENTIEYASAKGARIIQYGILMQLYSGSASQFQNFLYKKIQKLIPLPRAQVAARDYYLGLLERGNKLYKKHSHILFVTAAGNSATDLDETLSFPQGIRGENSLNVGASRFRDDITPFSSYGKTMVDALIPTVNFYVAVPGNQYMMSSATSVSVVIATNLAALIMEENFRLSAKEVKEIILKTVIHNPRLEDKVLTSGIIYHDRALEAARNSRFMSVDEAIARSFETVRD